MDSGKLPRPKAGGNVNGTATPPTTSVLFVCLGNICRSPSAEAVFRAVVERAGVAGSFQIDSCGTGGGSSDWYQEGGFSYHTGGPADSRMKQAASRRGVNLTSRSRTLAPEDFEKFDYLIAMDGDNIRDMRMAATHWEQAGRASVPAKEAAAKITLMTDYCKKFKDQHAVPDPYYGGPAGFDTVLDLLEDACAGLLQDIQEKKQ